MRAVIMRDGSCLDAWKAQVESQAHRGMGRNVFREPPGVVSWPFVWDFRRWSLGSA